MIVCTKKLLVGEGGAEERLVRLCDLGVAMSGFLQEGWGAAASAVGLDISTTRTLNHG